MKKLILPALLLAAIATNAQEAPLWMRDVKISPSGDRIVFTYKGDIFTVATTGGKATRLTSQPTYETSPIWSPDGRTIAFASDVNGNLDIFTIPADGSAGAWKRLTYNSVNETPESFTPDGNEIYFSAAIQDPASSCQYPSSRLTEVYSVPVDGGAVRQVLATPAQRIAWSTDGASFVYQDVKGFEDIWRKHHTSSVTRDIWRYTPSDGHHTHLINKEGEDLDPVLAGDTLYFLSERAPQRSLNIYRAPITDPSQAVPVTDFKRHPVRFLSRASNGTLSFTYDGEIYTLAPGARRPEKVRISITADYPSDIETITTTRGGREATVSPNGKNVAFLYRGDVYVTSVEYPTTKQVTDTPEAETDLTWGNDSTLFFTSERDGRYNIYRATPSRRGSENDFVHATVIDQERMFPADSHERTAARLSPDGKQLAFILDRNKLAVMDLDSRKVRTLTDGSTYLHRDGRFYYRWSPDSKWIALEVIDGRDPYSDIAILNVADGTLTNITRSGYFDSEPRWALDGNALTFISERYGMRNHASWGSQTDVMIVFMNQKAMDNFRLSKEDRELAEADGNKPAEREGDIEIETEGIYDRQIRLTPFSTELHDGILDADGTTLHFISEADDGCFLWELDTEEGDLEMKRRLSDHLASFDATPDSKEIFIFGKSMQKLGGKNISYRATKRLDPAAERRYMFDNIEREERERFLTKDMNGVDWTRMSAEYRKFLPHIANNYDFAELISEWLGELNVSHTGGRFRSTSDTKVDDRTAALGVLYDMTYTGTGMRIAEVLPQGPLYGLDPAVAPGDIITTIDGIPVTDSQPIETLLNERSGRRTLVGLSTPSGTRSIVVKPISATKQNNMLYERWVRKRAEYVDSLSHGRLGYVHLDGMDDENFRRAYSDLLGKYNKREGVVVDIRWNGGGRLHEDIEILLSGQKYFTQEIRGVASCDMPSRRWNKPSVMLMSEACYSNAHGTPWVYSHKGIGKTVGMPVPGTMSSVNWVTMQDPTLIYGIPVIAYRLADGTILENQQLEPDIRVENTPEEVAAGTDSQLRAAVEELLKQIDAQ